MKSDLLKRVAVAVLGIPLIFGCIRLGGGYFLVLVTAIMVISYREFVIMCRNKGYAPHLIPGAVFLILIAIDFSYFKSEYLLSILLSAFVFNAIYAIFKHKESVIENLSITLFGILYQSMFATLLLIRGQYGLLNRTDRFGYGLVMLLFLTIWACDTAAYLWGSKFGKHKLFMRLSPKKTWEGAIAGLMAAILVACFLKVWLVPELTTRQCLIAGILVGTIGQIGDLVESAFKRQAGVKDSSNFLPGHGGILDRFDSPLFVAPLVYLCFWIFGL